MSTFNNFNPLQGTRLGQPSYLGRNIYEAEHQQKTGKSGNIYPLKISNTLYGNRGASSGCTSCNRSSVGGDVGNPCPAGQHK